MQKKIVNVIRHLAFEDLGSFSGLFDELGLSIRYFDAGVSDLGDESLGQDDLLIVLGGPISVNDDAQFPFLRQEVALLRQRIEQDLPTLGICLGAQLLALAAGSAVYPGASKEIGWYDLVISDAGRQTPLRHLDAQFCRMLHWHGETFDLPSSATLLASSAACVNQAFSIGERVLGLQFHPEVTQSGLEQWYIGHIVEIGNAGIAVERLRSDSSSYAEGLQRQGQRFMREWLQGCGVTG